MISVSEYSNEASAMAEPQYPVLYKITAVNMNICASCGRIKNMKPGGTIRLYKDMVHIICNYSYDYEIRESVFPYRLIRTEFIEKDFIESFNLPNSSISIAKHGSSIKYETGGFYIYAEKQ